MSSDTAKENASVVDSSGTEWKHDMRNLDDQGTRRQTFSALAIKARKFLCIRLHLSSVLWFTPTLESPSYKGNEDGHHFRAEKAGHDRVGNSSVNKKGKLYDTRYFIIKSLNHQNIQLSVEKGIWATQVMNEPILEEAFNNSGKVILIFSVNMSGFFQGYAQMVSSVGWRRDNVWSQGSGKSNPWGRSFKVKWLRLNDLPFQKTLHLKNPLNDFKPVKISRDCQELPEEIGEALCELIDGESDGDRVLRRDNLPSKGPYVESPCSLGDGSYNGPFHTPWAGAPMPYPSFLYTQQANASRLYMAHQGSNGVTFPENLPYSSGSPKVAKVKHSQMNEKVNNLQVRCDAPSRADVWGLSADSPLASTLTDDDFLEMVVLDSLLASLVWLTNCFVDLTIKQLILSFKSILLCDHGTFHVGRRKRRIMEFLNSCPLPSSEFSMPTILSATGGNEKVHAMTYEEYLEVHSRRFKQVNLPKLEFRIRPEFLA
ncbi:hypothetical protein Tsubulata_017953 [Turnera subulata]|uniref:YTH domain-containing family protein n=1 Tax=Turnera subulata TaxID=218843 RepID=A0A9Q0GDM5_9ROSI|nr:hypothetical protein Tsubulata_017953 [Turnera subulata]